LLIDAETAYLSRLSRNEFARGLRAARRKALISETLRIADRVAISKSALTPICAISESQIPKSSPRSGTAEGAERRETHQSRFCGED
jgi:hypothetical protein